MSDPTPDFLLRHLARIVDSSDDAIVSKDLNGTILSWNAAAERMFGYSAQEAVGQSIRMIIPADRQSEEDYVLGQIRQGESVRHYETLRCRKDRSLIPISLTVSPIYDDSGVVIAASKIARDITEQTLFRATLEKQAFITRRLGEVGVAVTSSLDRETVVQKVTDIATELTQAEFGAFFYVVTDQRSGESVTKHAVCGVPKEALANFAQSRATERFARALHGQRAVRIDDLTRVPRYGGSLLDPDLVDGHMSVRSLLVVAVRGVSGDTLGALCFGHPGIATFTPQHEELALGIASWASVALENARLYLEARDADRLKDEFLAVLSHELRTPLNAIVGYSRLLRGGVLAGEKASRGLETLERNAISLTQIVEDVLDVSRIVSGKIRLDVRPVELPLVVHNAVATVQPAADAKHVRLQIIVDPRVGPVSGDPDRLQQVVWNLVSNAVKFTPKAGRVQVRVQQVNSHVEVEVSDTGIGIEPAFLPYVFERFRQADAGTTRKTGGLGLGLSIVRHIVEMHGGSVRVASEGEERGATFTVSLPLMIVHTDGVREPREHPRTEKLTPLARLKNLEGVRVLALDDEEDALGLLRVVLESAGAEVTTLRSPLDALDRVAEVQPDVMIVDLGMPDIDGFEFIRRIRAADHPAVRDIPAAALTAFARSDDRTKALESGFEMHLSKPVDPGELVASVATLMRRASRRR
jgi:PAS domain S-box-containing protein